MPEHVRPNQYRSNRSGLPVLSAATILLFWSLIQKRIGANSEKAMTSERQIKANRQNAKRSTGPATAAGKARSSRNAFRHGLSRPIQTRPGHDAGLQMLLAKMGSGPGPDVIELVQAKMELRRIRAVHYAVCLSLLQNPTEDLLSEIARINRYARAAFARQKRFLRSMRLK